MSYGYTIRTSRGSVEVWRGSAEEAKKEAHKIAYEKGIYTIEPLRQHWWQFWLKTEHSEIDKWLLNKE